MELKGRLKLIADMVPECQVVSDIGTDHAYLPVYLVKKGICRKAIASDVSPEPVKRARRNVEDHALVGKIEVRLGDGLEPIAEDEADVIVIAGMGGEQIARIIEKGFKKARLAQRLILQPMSRAEEMREWLYKNGFEILDENLVKEKGRIYAVSAVRYTGQELVEDLIYRHISRKLVEKKDPLLPCFIKKKLKDLEKALAGMKKSREADGKLLVNRERLLSGLREILEDVESR